MGVPTFAYVIGMKTVKKPVVLELVYCSNLQGRTVVNPGNVRWHYSSVSFSSKFQLAHKCQVRLYIGASDWEKALYVSISGLFF